MLYSAYAKIFLILKQKIFVTVAFHGIENARWIHWKTNKYFSV